MVCTCDRYRMAFVKKMNARAREGKIGLIVSLCFYTFKLIFIAKLRILVY